VRLLTLEEAVRYFDGLSESAKAGVKIRTESGSVWDAQQIARLHRLSAPMGVTPFSSAE
jgi:hypothetical protein